MVCWTNPHFKKYRVVQADILKKLKNTRWSRLTVIKSPRVPMIETSNELVVYSAQGVYGGVIWDILGGQDWELGGDVIHDAEHRAHYYQLCCL